MADDSNASTCKTPPKWIGGVSVFADQCRVVVEVRVVRGYFEEQDNPSGSGKIYRLRWGERPRPTLTTVETTRATFIRYLVQRGRLTEFGEVRERR